ALESQVVGVGAKGINVTGMPVEDAAEEVEFEIELALVGEPIEVAADRSGLGTFVGLLALVSHVFALSNPAGPAGAGPVSATTMIITARRGSAKARGRIKSAPLTPRQVRPGAGWRRRPPAARRSGSETRSRHPC